MALLTERDYKSTMTGPMTLVNPDDVDFRPVPLGSNTDAIPPGDLKGYDFSERDTHAVYRDPTGRYVHVLVAATAPNVFLVIVVDEPAQAVHGHFLLDLNKEYGLSR